MLSAQIPTVPVSHMAGNTVNGPPRYREDLSAVDMNLAGIHPELFGT